MRWSYYVAILMFAGFLTRPRERLMIVETRTLIMHAGGEWIAVTVDAVLEVTGAGEVTPPPPFFRGLAGEYMRGLVKRGEELVIALDVDRLLTATERLQLHAATGGGDGSAGHG